MLVLPFAILFQHIFMCSCSFVISVFQFQEQLGQGCSPEESDTFQAQGINDKVVESVLDGVFMLDFSFWSVFLKDQRFLTRCYSALNIYQSPCHS